MPIRRFELVNDGGKWKTRSASGQTRSASGQYNFVKINGKFYVTEDGGHIDLSHGRPVDFAGTIRFSGRSNRGRVREWTNDSGHYRPPKEFAPDVGLPLDLFEPVR